MSDRLPRIFALFIGCQLGILGCSKQSSEDAPVDPFDPGSGTASTSVAGSGGNTATTIATTPRTAGTGGKAYTEPVEVVALDAKPAAIATLKLEIPTDAVQRLDANPYSSPDIVGAFVDETGTRYENVAVNYRGAYALKGLIESNAPQRNWKLKFAKDKPYQNRREWNLTYEPDIRQRLAYELMQLAGVRLPSMQHVVLQINGSPNGLFLKYEDPDNKPWLLDRFGDDSGDLYKAAYDIPDQPRYFATLEVLGTTDAAYAMHYRKMTNNDDSVKATDYSALRTFIAGLNETSDAGIEAFLRQSFDVEKFIGYLVVANFISNWDSLPQRPKNFWLYQIPAVNRWVFLPWDLDATFQTGKFSLNPMGTDASIFYQFDSFIEYSGRLSEEGTKRPLVTRMMKVPAFRLAYVTRYRQALTSYLAKDYLLARIAELSALATAAAQTGEQKRISDAKSEMEKFVAERSASVGTELAQIP